ncbi:MAG: MFS transporter [Eggerthellaceae bacterium]|nr:MFS transporter [Eggerthellaceae bacterium]
MEETRQEEKMPKEGQHVQKDVLFTKALIYAGMTNLLIFMGWQMASVGIPVYIAELGGTEVEVGLSMTIVTIVATAIRPFAGTLADRYGRKVFLAWGLVLMIASTIAYAIFPIVGIVLSVRILHGIGWGFAATSNATICADVVPKRRFAEGMGYIAMTNSLALALGPIVAYGLIDAGNSTGMIYVSAAFTIVALIVAATFFVTEYKQPPLKKTTFGKDYFKLSNLFEKQALLPSMVVMMLCVAFGTISAFIALHAADKGISNVSVYFIVNAITNVVTRPIVGRYVDHHGYWGVGIWSCICFSLSLVMIGFADSLLMFGVGGFFVGIGLGWGMSVLQPMAVATVEPSRRGVATSTYFFFFDIGIGVGSFLGGIIASFVGYAGMYFALAIFPLIGCAIFMGAGKKRIGEFHKKQMS